MHMSGLISEVAAFINGLEAIDRIAPHSMNPVVQVVLARNGELNEFYVHCFIPGVVAREDLKGRFYPRPQWTFEMTLQRFAEILSKQIKSWSPGCELSPPLETTLESSCKATYTAVCQSVYGLDELLNTFSNSLRQLHGQYGIKRKI